MFPNAGYFTAQITATKQNYVQQQINIEIIIKENDDTTFINGSGSHTLDFSITIGIWIQTDFKDIGFFNMKRQTTLFGGTTQPRSPHNVLFFYSFEIFDADYDLNYTIVNSAIIRLYFDPANVGNLDNLRLIKYVAGDWVNIDITVNKENNYIVFTTSTFSIYALTDTSTSTGPSTEAPGDFPIIIIIIIIIGSVVGVAGGAYTVRSKKVEKGSSLSKGKAAQKRSKLVSSSPKQLRIPLKQEPEVGGVTKPSFLKEEGELKKHKGKVAPTHKKKGKGKEEHSEEKPLTPQERAELAKTESEVAVQENKIACIVHKGEIVGDIYLCPKCRAFYCQRCAKVLKAKGDTCWSCENEITVSLTEEEKQKILQKEAGDGKASVELLKKMILEDPVFFEAIRKDKSFKEIPDINNYEFSLLKHEELDRIDKLEMTLEEKKEFIKDILYLDSQERKDLIDEMLEKQNKTEE